MVIDLLSVTDEDTGDTLYYEFDEDTSTYVFNGVEVTQPEVSPIAAMVLEAVQVNEHSTHCGCSDCYYDFFDKIIEQYPIGRPE